MTTIGKMNYIPSILVLPFDGWPRISKSSNAVHKKAPKGVLLKEEFHSMKSLNRTLIIISS